MNRLVAIPLTATALLAGCASSPPVSQLRQGVAQVDFVARGTKPLTYSTGVIDTSSFWAQYGAQVGTNLGGSLIVAGVTADAQTTQMSQAERNAEMVRVLVGEDDIATKINNALLPQMAAAWHVPYDPNHASVMLSPLNVEPKSQRAVGLHSNASLVLTTEVSNINLTERLSIGGGLASGFTLGMNKKNVTTEVIVLMRAFKPEPDGSYKQVWTQRCGILSAAMNTRYHVDELQAAPAKMTEMLAEATDKTVASCSKVLGNITT